MTLTVTPTVDLTSTPPSVSLSVVDDTGTVASVTIQRFASGGGSETVRTSNGGPLPLTTVGSTKVGTLIDYWAPYGTPVQYSVDGGVTLTAPVTVAVTQAWLTHLFNPGRSMPINFRPGNLMEEALTGARGVFKPLGRANPIVVTDGTRSTGSSLTVSVETATDVARVRRLLSDGTTLLLNLPPSLATDFPTCYVAILDAKLTRWTDVVIDDNRDVTLPFTVVDSPVSGTAANTSGGTVGTRTWADLSVERVTWANAETAYSTWAKAEAGTPG